MYKLLQPTQIPYQNDTSGFISLDSGIGQNLCFNTFSGTVSPVF